MDEQFKEESQELVKESLENEAKQQGDENKIKDDYFKKYDERFEMLENSFGTLIDTITPLVSGNSRQPQKAQESTMSVSEEDIEDLGFDQKQVKFIDSLVQKTAEKTVNTVLSNNTAKSAAANYEAKTFQEFPEMKNKKSRLYQVADNIAAEKLSIDPNAGGRPDFAYSCAIEAERKIRMAAQTQTENNFSSNNTRNQVIQRSHIEGSGSSGRSNSGQSSQGSGDLRSDVRKLLRGGA